MRKLPSVLKCYSIRVRENDKDVVDYLNNQFHVEQTILNFIKDGIKKEKKTFKNGETD